MTNLTKFAILTSLFTIHLGAADWNPRLAADYLDSRQQEWFAWKTAKAPGGPCFSCHTSATYLLARPALRRALGESQPTSYETGLLAALSARVPTTDPTKIMPLFSKEPLASQAYGVESIYAALFLSRENPESAEAHAAVARMWSAQLQEGKSKGAWQWFSLELDPWEMPESRFYGATLAALAASSSQDSSHVAELTNFLRSEQKTQPLHNRAMLLWVSTKSPRLLSPQERSAIAKEIWNNQQPDGGWTMESLGPWKQHANAPESSGSNSYATGLMAFVLEQSGTAASDPRLALSLDWLKLHQNREGGYWPAESMNKRFEAGSMQSKFMQDAATAYASLALLGAGQP
jgi:squalene-hopene/tetraprenyl-beta-curcumene cyclase